MINLYINILKVLKQGFYWTDFTLEGEKKSYEHNSALFGKDGKACLGNGNRERNKGEEKQGTADQTSALALMTVYTAY